MKQNDQITPPTFSFVKKGTWGWKVALGYDIFMMVLIIINLICLSGNALLMSDFGGWLFNFIHLPELLQFYRTALRPWVIITESWFTSFLVIELLVRWAIAIIGQHHKRWFFFPFIHYRLFRNCVSYAYCAPALSPITCISMVIKSFRSVGINGRTFITIWY